MSNWNTGDPDNKPKKDPQALSWVDHRSVTQAIKDIAYHQLGLFAEPFSMSDMADLFCPPNLLAAVRQIYDVEEGSWAEGEVYIECAPLLNEQIFEGEGDPYCNCTSAVLRLKWNRVQNPGGFVTPTPVFGSRGQPVGGFKGPLLTEAHGNFVAQVQQLIRIMGRWSMVLWVFDKLQVSVRTPQQMRYVWPAIYTLATQAGLPMATSLAGVSSRAGMNASPHPLCKPFLKPTYEVVTNSVLLNTDPLLIKRWNEGQMQLVSCTFMIRPMEGNSIGVLGL